MVKTLYLGIAALFLACTLAGENSPGSQTYWPVNAFISGRPKTIRLYTGGVSGLPVTAGAYGQVKLYSGKKTAAQLQTGIPLIVSGAGPERLGTAGSTDFRLFINNSESEWKTTGEFFVYFFYYANYPGSPSEITAIYESINRITFSENAAAPSLYLSGFTKIFPEPQPVN